jgi:hypothetical protein
MTHKLAHTFALAWTASAALGLAGCYRLPGAPPPPAPRALLLPVPPDSVVAAAAHVLSQLEWSVTVQSPDKGVLQAERIRAQGGNAQWIACAPGYRWWGPGLPRSTMRVDLTATPGSEGTRVAIVATVVNAWAWSPFDRITEPVKCVSSGEIEATLAGALRERFS